MTSRRSALSVSLAFLGLLCSSLSFEALDNKKPGQMLTKEPVSSGYLLRERKERALELLPSLSERIEALESVIWKVRLKGSLAELVGRHDPVAARRLLEQSLQSLDTVPVLAELEQWGKKDGFPSFELNRWRTELLTRAAKADPQSAESLIEEASSAGNSEPLKTERTAEKKAFLFGRVAQSLATEQPDVAARWIEKSFETAGTGWSTQALDLIRQQNPQLADVTLAKVLSQLEGNRGSSLQSVMALADYLFPGKLQGTLLFSDGVQGVVFRMGSVGNVSTAEASPNVASRFLNLAYERCLAGLSGVKPSQINAGTGELDSLGKAVSMLQGLLEDRSPEKAVGLQLRLDELGKQLPLWNGMPLADMFNFLGGGRSSKQTNEQAVAQLTPEMRDSHYAFHAIRAIRRGQFEEGIASLEKVKSDEVKAEIQSELVARQIADSIEQGQLDSALSQTRSYSDPYRQIRYLTQIAQKRIDQKKTDEALLCLVEAEQLLNKPSEPFSRPYFAAEIAEKMAGANPERAFSSVARLVEEINRTSTIPKEPKPELPPPLQHPLDPTTDALFSGKAFSLLAEADFDAALAMAQSIVRPETSIAAQLAVCRAALSGTAKGLGTKPGGRL